MNTAASSAVVPVPSETDGQFGKQTLYVELTGDTGEAIGVIQMLTARRIGVYSFGLVNTERPEVKRLTIVLRDTAEQRVVDQVIQQIDKLVVVTKVQQCPPESVVRHVRLLLQGVTSERIHQINPRARVSANGTGNTLNASLTDSMPNIDTFVRELGKESIVKMRLNAPIATTDDSFDGLATK